MNREYKNPFWGKVELENEPIYFKRTRGGPIGTVHGIIARIAFLHNHLCPTLSQRFLDCH